ncbi:hypothetical protein Tsubulata_030301 [Turnera subulata]|uniref:L-ascorbate oxidase n=1 Tax=Turnera subulata TaxID=218843 RepID=A0A9Q0GI77_9ROSI|nr:hypothetical protein Tsubulata_030301 [Turnera subulata]
MGNAVLLHLICGVLAVLALSPVNADNPYRYYTWTVTYGTIAPLGVPQQVILINGQFPGPKLEVVTNDNIVLNLINKLDQPFLNGIKQRKNSWQDGVLGTNCPIPPNSNYTYNFQPKDQIGTYTYFPSTLLHKASGGYGAFNVYKRPQIPIPYPYPDGDFTLLIGDWYQKSHKTLQETLDSGVPLPFPDGVLINGQAHTSFTGDQGKTYMFRVSNVGLSTSLNFRIQGHTMKLVEVEGSHTIQEIYDSLDVHVGQSVAPPKDYYIVASTRFTQKVLTATALLHYSNSHTPASGPLPAAPSYQYHGSMVQARTFRWNLTSNAARPNPQGSFHYGKIVPTKKFLLVNSAPLINGKQRYAVNQVSYINPDTPLKLADYYNIPGVFTMDFIQSEVPSGGPTRVGTSVLPANLHDFIEVVFQNNENTMQSWHLDGYDFWPVGYGSGQWTPSKNSTYNLVDALTRHTVQVFPKSWTAILVSLDNQGMWNLRMKQANVLCFGLGLLALLSYVECATHTTLGRCRGCILPEDPYRYFTLTVTYGTVKVLDQPQRLVIIHQEKNFSWVILVNGQFPGPNIDCVTNDNIIVNVINKNGIKQRRTTWQDGVQGTNCPIPPNSNWTYKFQVKDQIGSYNYFPSIALQRAAGGFGGFNIMRKANVIGTWLTTRIQGHTLKLVEVEGYHNQQREYDSIDVHPGQSVAVLVTLNGTPKDYYLVASTRFTKTILTSTGILRYAGSNTPPSLPLPIGPPTDIQWSIDQARTIRLNLTANGPGTEPQGSFQYGRIKVVKQLIFANSEAKINGKLRYAVNGISYVDPSTPLKLADWFNIPGVFTLEFPIKPTKATPVLGTSVVGATFRDFVEIVFVNPENSVQTWHLDGKSFYVVAYGTPGQPWTRDVRNHGRYNLHDAIERHTVQVYPGSWTAVLLQLDNKGMWNLRSTIWSRRYLGQQLYVRVWNAEKSPTIETDIPANALFCGKAKHPRLA